MKLSDFKQIKPEYISTCKKLIVTRGRCEDIGCSGDVCPFDYKNATNRQTCGQNGYAKLNTAYVEDLLLLESAKQFIKLYNEEEQMKQNKITFTLEESRAFPDTWIIQVQGIKEIPFTNVIPLDIRQGSKTIIGTNTKDLVLKEVERLNKILSPQLLIHSYVITKDKKHQGQVLCLNKDSLFIIGYDSPIPYSDVRLMTLEEIAMYEIVNRSLKVEKEFELDDNNFWLEYEIDDKYTRIDYSCYNKTPRVMYLSESDATRIQEEVNSILKNQKETGVE